MYPSRFRYEAPHSLAEAIGLLADGGDVAKVLAGGQSLIPLMKLRFAAPELIVDINNLPGLNYHRLDSGRHAPDRRPLPSRRPGAL
jgi:aerobic carbon-monoxide dehydrogenase medium subunit